MIISRLKAKLKFFHKVFIAPPKGFQFPKNSDVLIYDTSGSEVLTPYLKTYRVIIMTVRGESINVPCALLSVFRLSFWKGKLLNAYVETYIQAVSPKLIITYHR